MAWADGVTTIVQPGTIHLKATLPRIKVSDNKRFLVTAEGKALVISDASGSEKLTDQELKDFFGSRITQLRALDMNRMSPMQAWEALRTLQGLLGEKK